MDWLCFLSNSKYASARSVLLQRSGLIGRGRLLRRESILLANSSKLGIADAFYGKTIYIILQYLS